MTSHFSQDSETEPGGWNIGTGVSTQDGLERGLYSSENQHGVRLSGGLRLVDL